MRNKIDANRTYVTWVPVTIDGAERRTVKTLYDGTLEALVPSCQLQVSEVIICSPVEGEEESIVVIPLEADYKEKVVVSIWDMYSSADECNESGGVKDLQGAYKLKECRKILDMIRDEVNMISPGAELDIIFGTLTDLYEDTIGRMD